MNRRLSYIAFGVFIFFLLMIPLCLALLPRGKTFYHLVAAQKLLKEQDVSAALAQIQKAVDMQPQSVMALRSAANIYMAGGRYEDAELMLKKLLALSSEDAMVYRDMGLIYLYAGDKEGAREAAEKAVSLAPESAPGYHLMGAIAFEEKDFETAEKHLSRAVALDSENIGSHYLLGSIYFEQERPAQAVDELTIVTRKEQDFAAAHSLIGLCYLKMNLHLHALTSFKKAVELNPADYNSMYNVACVYSLRNKPHPAVKWLERAIEMGFTDFEHMKEDADLDNIRQYPEYIRLLERNQTGIDSQREEAEGASEAGMPQMRAIND